MVVEDLHDAYNNLTSIQAANGSASCNPASATGTPSGTVFDDYAYTYAPGSDLQQTETITSPAGNAAWNFYYDPLRRLLEASAGQADTYTYAYDGDGNLISKTTSPTTGAIQTATYNAADELCWIVSGSSSNSCSSPPGGAYTAQYDNGTGGAGNLTSLGASAGTTSLGYNVREQTNSLNPFGAGAQTLSYRGSGQNHPVQIGNTSGGVAPELEENTLGISAQEPSSGSATYYTRAPDGSLLAERTPTTSYYYVQDANQSVVALTNSSDTVANTYTYDPYGTTTSSTGSAPNIFGYDGGYNAQGGLVLFGTRYYNPATGTWTQPDPDAQSLAQDPTQADAYSFASDDPINNVDPSGECARYYLCPPHPKWMTPTTGGKKTKKGGKGHECSGGGGPDEGGEGGLPLSPWYDLSGPPPAPAVQGEGFPGFEGNAIPSPASYKKKCITNSGLSG